MSRRSPHLTSRSPQLTDLNPINSPTSLPPPQLSIKQRPLEERPRERLISLGAAHLSPEELLAVVLNTGRGRDSDVYALACELLREFQGVAKLSEAPLSALCEVKGVGPVKGSRLVAAFELARRASAAQTPHQAPYPSEHITPLPSSPPPPPPSRLERVAAQAYELLSHEGGAREVSLIAYPVSCGLSALERLVTLSLGADLSALGALSEREGAALSGACLRRLLSASAEPTSELGAPWGLVSVLPQVAHLNDHERAEVKAAAEVGLERLSESGALLGVSFEEAILIGEGAWVSLKEPSVLRKEGGEL